MLKKIKKTVEKEERCCDFCEQPLGGCYLSNGCYICHRDVCYKCAKQHFAGRHGDYVEMAIHVCVTCQKHPEIIGTVQAILDLANKELREQMKSWRKEVMEMRDA